jgi:hypothetical protein
MQKPDMPPSGSMIAEYLMLGNRGIQRTQKGPRQKIVWA